MKKIYIILFVFTLLTVSCNEEDVVLSETPEISETETGSNTSDSEYSGEWVSGMPYVAYPGMPKNEPGEEVNVIVIDAQEHGRNIMQVLRNESWPWTYSSYDEENKKQVFFPTHSDIKLHLTESYSNYNPDNVPCDIVNRSLNSYTIRESKIILSRLEDKDKFPKFPLVVVSAGNGVNMFTQYAWDVCVELGSLGWSTTLVPHFGWEAPYTAEQLELYKPGDVMSAYIVQNMDNNGHKKDWIVVGRSDGRGNKPGPILKDRWICTYYSFGFDGVKKDGTSFSAPYVVKIAAEIKRRAPHYTNDEIAQLIFSTADDLGEPGCDEVYGHGRINPVEIWKELTKRGY